MWSRSTPRERKRLKLSKPDLEIHVGKRENVKVFHCHSTILANHSACFDEMLSELKRNKRKMIIRLPDLGRKQFETMLEFIKPRPGRQLEFNEALWLVELYDKYHLHIGRELCDNIIHWHVIKGCSLKVLVQVGELGQRLQLPNTLLAVEKTLGKILTERWLRKAKLSQDMIRSLQKILCGPRLIHHVVSIIGDSEMQQIISPKTNPLFPIILYNKIQLSDTQNFLRRKQQREKSLMRDPVPQITHNPFVCPDDSRGILVPFTDVSRRLTRGGFHPAEIAEIIRVEGVEYSDVNGFYHLDGTMNNKPLYVRKIGDVTFQIVYYSSRANSRGDLAGWYLEMECIQQKYTSFWQYCRTTTATRKGLFCFRDESDLSFSYRRKYLPPREGWQSVKGGYSDLRILR